MIRGCFVFLSLLLNFEMSGTRFGNKSPVCCRCLFTTICVRTWLKFVCETHMVSQVFGVLGFIIACGQQLLVESPKELGVTGPTTTIQPYVVCLRANMFLQRRSTLMLTIVIFPTYIKVLVEQNLIQFERCVHSNKYDGLSLMQPISF